MEYHSINEQDPVVISSDEEETPPRRNRRAHRQEPAGRGSPLPAPTLLLTPTPPPEAGPANAPVHDRPAQAPAPHAGYDYGALGGAEPIDLDEYFDARGDLFWQQDGMPAAAPREATPPRDGQIIVIDGEEVFIPDSPPPARAEPNRAPRQETINQEPTQAEEFTADVCLSRMLTIFPDIDHDHVLKMYKDYAFVPSPGGAGGGRLETMVDKIITSGSYPKRVTAVRKRKREEDGPDKVFEQWEGPDREIAPAATRGAMASILKADFPEITKNVIAQELQKEKHLYQSYLALAKMKDSSDANTKWRGRAALRDLASADTIATNCGWPPMTEELRAARECVKGIRHLKVIEDARKLEEQKNLQKAIDANETAECQACFDDLPMNRQIHCDGETAHFTCFDCATAYVKSEVGESRCRVLCTAGCGASFARAQLHLLADKALLDQLEQLQQEKDIRDAGLDDLEECPFCDYKAILPPIEEDFEFRCANEECERVSCRRCKAVSHIPMSCEEHAKDNKLSVRHRIEEAMTAALIRECNKCKKKFIKEYGCNKMTCPSCGNLQCYVCSQTLKDYNHFDQQPQGGGRNSKKCPLYDNVEERHEREIKEAEAAARAEVINDNPNVSVEDLQIKVSDAVQKATDERVQRAGAVPGGIPPGYGAHYAGLGQLLGGGAHALAAELVRGERARDDGMLAQRRQLALQQLARLRARQEEIVGDRGLANAGGLPAPGQAGPQLHPGAGLALAGGFNEDPFGGGDDGDPLAFRRLMGMNMPGDMAPRAPPPRTEPRGEDARHLPRRAQAEAGARVHNPYLEELRNMEYRNRFLVQHADRMRQLEERQRQAMQNFNERRGGRGEVFRRDPQDPRRQHQGGGWPDQN